MPSSITLTVKHLSTSTSFFLSTLQPLEYVYRGRIDNTIGFGLKDSPPDFWISQETPGVPAGAAHVAFPATSQSTVKDFFIAALKAGGRCHGEPALRDPATGYFSAAVIDFDGNSIEAVHRPDLIDEGYGSRPSSVSSVSSVKSKPVPSANASTVASRASTAKQAPSEARSVAPSHVSKAVSGAPTTISAAASSVSKTASHVSKAHTAAPTQVSRAASHSSRAPTSISRAPPQSSGQYVSAQPDQAQTVTHTMPTGEVVTSILSETRGAIHLAQELVNHVRPALDSSNSAPNIRPSSNLSDPNSHKPSDTIVGTLLGVAAGAALHYAYTKATESGKKPEAISTAAPRPNIARTFTEPSFADGENRMYYYHEYARSPANHPYAIEAPPSAYGFSQHEPSRIGSQRYITMQNNDERLSDYTTSHRPRRRSSLSNIDVKSFASQSRASQAPRSSTRMLGAPPNSYRAPTAITMAETDNHSRASGRSRSRSRVSSILRSNSVSGESKASRRSSSSRHASDEDLRSRAKSHISRRSSIVSRSPSITSQSEATTVKPIKPTPSATAPSHVSRAPTTTMTTAPSRAPSKTSTVIKPENTPLPPSRAGTTISASPSDYQSTHSKANKTVIGRMIEKDRQSALTKSVVGKLEDSRKLNVPRDEVEPSDSVSQISSVRSSRRSSRR
ncbi:hypothetical protein LTS08_000284 [Lithohypha guttulata]|nr:hypothetical protein LTS08_000284 [Lithohypha guttulata]